MLAAEWAAEEGQDFIADHSSPAIDYAAIHAWVRGAGGSLVGQAALADRHSQRVVPFLCTEKLCREPFVAPPHPFESTCSPTTGSSWTLPGWPPGCPPTPRPLRSS